MYKKFAYQKLPKALTDLGNFYLKGILGYNIDLNKARELYKQAADYGFAQAQHNLAYLYHREIGIKRDLNKARELYQKAADQGHKIAQYNLALMYQKGQGGEKQLDKAIELYQKAADQGDKEAQYKLALLYENGIGVENLVKARELYQKAADQGYTYAKYALPQIEQRIKKEKIEIKRLKEAADNKDEEALLKLGEIYYNKGDLNQAIKYYEQVDDKDGLGKIMVDFINEQNMLKK